jgi:hypothetical protein
MSYDPRWGDDPRDRADDSRDLGRGGRAGSDPRDRQVDPRDVFMERVDLQSDPARTSGHVDLGWTLAAPGSGIRAGNHHLTIRWKVESITR